MNLSTISLKAAERLFKQIISSTGGSTNSGSSKVSEHQRSLALMVAAKARFTKENGKITAERDMAYALTQMDPCIKGNG